MRNKKGITLVSLVITIIVLSILASIATYSGISVIKSSKFTAFTAELKIMQTGVNTIYEDSKKNENGSEQYGDLLTGEVQEQANKVFTSEAAGITDQTGYRYWSSNYIKNTLKIEGVEQSFFVNLEKRSVVSYEGLEYEGETYYTLEQLPNGLYNVEYNAPNAETPTFDVKTETIGDDKWKITISNIQYSGYIDKWQVAYQLENSDYWITTKELSFVVNEEGNYNIQLVNENIKSESKKLQVVTTVEEVRSEGKVFEKKTTIQDTFGNKVVVPEGFKVAQDSANDVTGGMVIEDVSHGSTTAGSQFVWIPVGTVKYSGGAKTINLDRYTFADDGTPTAQGDNVIDSLYQELATSSYGNTTAKDIAAFKTSAVKNGGYYIGRYEARTATERASETDALTAVTVKPSDYVYNYITQQQAATQCRNMYNSSTSSFTSDLINSYAWDTAIVFLQEFDNRSSKPKVYSRQTSLNTSFVEKGTNNLSNTEQQDKICNIWDMASSDFEWTTETDTNSDGSCVGRGGCYFSISSSYTSYRHNTSTTGTSSFHSFRPSLYLKN